ncbi:CBS domain-containing protein [Actinophytocola sp. NPDC049390]|uniref:CBS domain-containing protein n=1 Tax=Actinophytocola sp. NPDC049390 TaxID=3363894 RepID=UPI0037B6FB52
MTVASVMTEDVVTATPGTPFRELVAAMTEKSISALPVVDEQGGPIGVVSEADLLAKQEFHGGSDGQPRHDRAARERWYRAQGGNAAEVMTTPVRAVHADEPVSSAARLLAKAGIRRVFVVDRYGKLVGVVARRDLLRAYLTEDGDLGARITAMLVAAGIPADVVDVEVSSGLVTLGGEVSRRGLADAAVRMVRATPGVVGVRNNLRYLVDDVVVGGASPGVWTGFRP